jgi:hypothetical protein
MVRAELLPRARDLSLFYRFLFEKTIENSSLMQEKTFLFCKISGTASAFSRSPPFSSRYLHRFSLLLHLFFKKLNLLNSFKQRGRLCKRTALVVSFSFRTSSSDLIHF